jgi:hypothetical protein
MTDLIEQGVTLTKIIHLLIIIPDSHGFPGSTGTGSYLAKTTVEPATVLGARLEAGFEPAPIVALTGMIDETTAG